jgi:hypothetical protein
MLVKTKKAAGQQLTNCYSQLKGLYIIRPTAGYKACNLLESGDLEWLPA